jgi:hypothetical protein
MSYPTNWRVSLVTAARLGGLDDEYSTTPA